jgi:hypothetical protein
MKGAVRKTTSQELITKIQEEAKRKGNNELLSIITQQEDCLTYHPRCLTFLKNQEREGLGESQEKVNLSKNKEIVLCEMAEKLEKRSSESLAVFHLASLVDEYARRLAEMGSPLASKRMHATRLKEELIEKLPGLEVRTIGKNVYLVFKESLDLMIESYGHKRAYTTKEEAVAMDIREEILQNDVTFAGSLEDQKNSVPQRLLSMIDLILKGKLINNQNNQAALTISQLIVFNCRTQRNTSVNAYHSQQREPSLPVYTSLKLYSTVRSKGLIDAMYEIGLGVSYDRLLNIVDDLTTDMCAIQIIRCGVPPSTEAGPVHDRGNRQYRPQHEWLNIG